MHSNALRSSGTTTPLRPSEESNFKPKADRNLKSMAVKKAMNIIEENLEQEVLGEYFNGEDGFPRWKLMEMMGPSHASRCVRDQLFHIPSSRKCHEWIKELEAGGAEVQDSFKGESHETTLQDPEAQLLGR